MQTPLDKRITNREAANLKSIKAFYEEKYELFSEATDIEQAMILSQLHQFHEYIEWIIGDFLLKIDESIMCGKKKDYKSLNDWLDQNYSLLGFARSTAYKYVKIRRSINEDIIDKIGMPKAFTIAKITDKTNNEKIKKELIRVAENKPDLTDDEFNFIAQEIIEKKITEPLAKEKAEYRKIAINSITASIKLPDDKSIVIKCRNNKIRDELNSVIQEALPGLKEKAYKRLIEKGVLKEDEEA